MSRSNSQIKTLLDAWDILVRFRWRFMVPAFGVALLVLAGSLALPRKYEAEAIFERRTDAVLSDIMNRNATASYEHVRQSMVQEISGAPAVDQLMTQITPWLAERARRGGPQVDTDALRNELERSILVRYDIASPTVDRVRVSYVGPDRELARKIANTLVENYITTTRAEIDARLKESTAFFEAEVATSRKGIEAQENRQLSYEIEHGSLLPENPNGVETLLADTQNQLTDAGQKLDAANLKAGALEKTLAETPKTLPSLTTERNPELKAMQDKLHELQAKESDDVNVLKMTDKHPDLESLREEMAQLEGKIAHTDAEVVTQKRVTANPQYAQVGLMLTQARAEQEATRKQHDALQARVAELQGQSQQLFPIRAEYRKLTRDVEQNQRQLAFWEDNLRRVKMATSAENGNRGVCLEFIKPCDPLRLPVSPDLAQVLMAAFLLAFTCGTVSVVAAHRADECFRDGDHLATTFGLPLFGSVSEIISGHQRHIRSARNMILYPLSAAGMALALAAMSGLVFLSLRDPARFHQITGHPDPVLNSSHPSQATTPAPAQARAVRLD